MIPEVNKITILPGINKFGEKEKFNKMEIKRGEVVAIVGPTGAGKSQLLYDIEKLAQKDTQSKRQILVNNQIPDKNWRFNPERKLIASLAQTMNFLTDMPVSDFLKLHLESRGKEANDNLLNEVIQEANEITGEPISPEMNLLNLSGGQSRALMISDVANISSSPIILIDEIENAGIRKDQAIKVLLEEGKIVLIVTHDPSLALNSDRRIIIKNGGIVNVIKTTSKEKDIARYLSWIDSYNLNIREKIREGKVINDIGISCKPIEGAKNKN